MVLLDKSLFLFFFSFFLQDEQLLSNLQRALSVARVQMSWCFSLKHPAVYLLSFNTSLQAETSCLNDAGEVLSAAPLC